MNLLNVSQNEAIQVYAVALAYTYDVELNLDAIVEHMSVETTSKVDYRVVKRANAQAESNWVSRPAHCVFSVDNQTWMVKFSDGKVLHLLDTGRQWELVKDDTSQNSKRGKKSSKSRQEC
jgi:hypothetical protein